MKANTKERVLEAACDIFAVNGYQNTTIQDICDKAKANVASVNYYFRSKDGLYEKVWKKSYDSAGLPPLSPPKNYDEAYEWLSLQMENRISGIFDEGPKGRMMKILLHEMAVPTPHLKKIISEVVEPGRVILKKVLDLLLGDAATPYKIACVEKFIESQYVFFSRLADDKKEIFPGEKVTEEEIKKFVTTVKSFIFGGIETLKK